MYRITGDAAVVREAIREAWQRPGASVITVMRSAEIELMRAGRDPKLVICGSWL
jgi:hypothetical protein